MAASFKETSTGNRDASSTDPSSAGMNILYLAVLLYSLEPSLFLERQDTLGKGPGRNKSSYVFILENPSTSKEATNRLTPHSIRLVKVQQSNAVVSRVWLPLPRLTSDVPLKKSAFLLFFVIFSVCS
uniref:Uncharacterized protein n=1 Tax=Mus spicilegus TaxID=10103 RepID=A0A8C6MRL9_MUSSI